MRIKLILLSLLLFVGLGRVTSQENLNKYKYTGIINKAAIRLEKAIAKAAYPIKTTTSLNA